MDFSTVFTIFKDELGRLLTYESRGLPITEEEVKHVSKILRNFVNFRLKTEYLHSFLDDVLKYFLLLIYYCKYSEVPSQKYNFTVRMALNIYLFVVDSAKIYDTAFRKTSKIIVKIIEVHGGSPFVKEFLRMHIGLIKQVSKSATLQITNKSNKSLLLLLHTLIKDTSDVEFQAIVIEIFLRYIRFKVTQPTFFEQIFPEMANVPYMETFNNSSSYQTIRMILDALNEYSFKVFSINCVNITLDHVTVTEYDEANVDSDVWLDVDTLQGSLSFFCNQTFLSSFTNTKFCHITDWEVISFQAQEVLNAKFVYNSPIDTLEITIKIKTSAFNLFSNVKFDTVRQLIIKISKNANRYGEFVSEILPKLFPAYYASEKFIEKVTADHAILDLVLSESDDAGSSSPVIEHFEVSGVKNKKKMSAMNKSSSDNLEQQSFFLSESDSVIEISDDNSDSNVQINNVNKEKVGRSKKTSVCDGEVVKDRTRQNKVSRMEEKTTFNKSITPISFTESVLGKSRKSKISTVKKPKLKISTNLTSLVVEGKSSTDPNNVSKTAKTTELVVKSPIVYMSERSERELSEPRSESLQLDKLNYSTAKVKDWLKTIEKDSENEEACLEQQAIPETDKPTENDEEMKDIHSVSSCASNKTSNIEKTLRKLFSEEDESNKNDKADVNMNSIVIVPDVLDMLLTPKEDQCREEEVTKNQSAELEKKSAEQSHGLKNSSDDSNLFLSQLISKKQMPKIDADVIIHEETVKVPKQVNEQSLETEFEMVQNEQPSQAFQTTKETNEKSAEALNQDLILEQDNPVLGEEKSTQLHQQISSEEELPLKDAENDEAGLESPKALTDGQTKAQSENVTMSSDRQNHSVSFLNTTKSNKRKLYNPNDLSYLDAMMADENSKADESLMTKVAELEARVNKTPKNQINNEKKPRIKKTDTKTSKKKGNKDDTISKNPKLVSSSTSRPKRMSKPPVTELTFDKAFTNLKEKIRTGKKEVKKRKKVEAAQRKSRGKGRPLLMNEISSPSTPSSLEPFGQCMKSPSNKRKLAPKDNNQNKVLKTEANIEIEGGAIGKTKGIKVLSNIVVRPATSSHECLCNEGDFGKESFSNFLRFLQHTEKYHPNLMESEECDEVYNALKRHFEQK